MHVIKVKMATRCALRRARVGAFNGGCVVLVQVGKVRKSYNRLKVSFQLSSHSKIPIIRLVVSNVYFYLLYIHSKRCAKTIFLQTLRVCASGNREQRTATRALQDAGVGRCPIYVAFGDARALCCCLPHTAFVLLC